MAKGDRGGRRLSTSNSLQKHFKQENKRVDDFLQGDSKSGYKDLTMDNGQIFERYTNDKEFKEYLKTLKSDGITNDTSIYVKYKNGAEKTYTSEDNISKLKITGIDKYIEDNGYTTVVYGKDVKITNYNEKYAGQKMTHYGESKDLDDWRAE